MTEVERSAYDVAVAERRMLEAAIRDEKARHDAQVKEYGRA